MDNRPFEHQVELKRLAAIVESSQDAIISKSLDGTVRSWNAGAAKIFGYSAEEMIGQPITRIIPPELQEEETSILSRLRAGKRIEHFDTVRLTRDGRRIDISLTVSPLRDSDGKVVGASKVARDVTDRKRAEAMQRLLIGELNHRVKNTLAIVQSIASQSLAASSDPADFVESFNGRLQALARAHDLLIEKRMEGISLRDLVEAQLNAEDGGSSQTSVSGPDVIIQGSFAIQLMLIAHELMTNARKYGALSTPDGALQVDWDIEGNDQRTLRFRWKETGVKGLKPPDRTGFGTSLIDKTVKANQGEADISYGPEGIDVRITLKLPALFEAETLVQRRPSSVEHREEQSPPSLEGLNILIVEDEAVVGMDIEMKLELLGCEAIELVSTVGEAREALLAHRPDIVLLDANLHGERVDSIARALNDRDIPFLFMTGYGPDALPKNFGEAEILSKPLNERKFNQALSRLAALIRQRRQS